jgi:hypothetical protein
MAFTFLSDEWFAEVDKIRESAGDEAIPSTLKDLTVNIVVTGGPEGDKEVHLSGGSYEKGLNSSAPTKVTVPFEVAKSIFIEGNQQAAIQAFMSGQIKVEGDMTKLMALQAAPAPTDAQKSLQARLQEITL